VIAHWKTHGEPWGALIAQKRPGAKNWRLARSDRGSVKPETDFPATTLQHNASFPGEWLPFWAPFDAVFDREPNLLPSPYPPSLSPLLQAQNIASPKWLPTTYAPGLSKTAACAACCMDRFNYKYGRPSYFLLASSLLQHANRPHNFLT
jgi:hypothetical protein